MTGLLFDKKELLIFNVHNKLLQHNWNTSQFYSFILTTEQKLFLFIYVRYYFKKLKTWIGIRYKLYSKRINLILKYSLLHTTYWRISEYIINIIINTTI